MEDLDQHLIILAVSVLCVIETHWEQQVLLWIFKSLLTGGGPWFQHFHLGFTELMNILSSI